MTRSRQSPQIWTSTLPPIPEQLSEMLDTYGPEMTEDRLCSVLEQVCERMRTNSDAPLEVEVPSDLERACLELLESPAEQGEHRALLEGLETLRDTLQHQSLEPELELESVDEATEPPSLVMCFSSAWSMRWTLPDIFDLDGGFIETDVRPGPLLDLETVVRAPRVERSVSMMGRVVRSAPNGIALRCNYPSSETMEQLRSTQRALWQHRLEGEFSP